MCRTPKKKRPLRTSNNNQRKSKQFKPNNTNGNEIEAEPKKSNDNKLEPANEPPSRISTRLNYSMKTINSSGSCEDDISLPSSDAQLVFPIVYL